ncbi:MAG: transporter [Pseudomonadota bacterium]
MHIPQKRQHRLAATTAAIAALLLACAGTANATEGGGNSYALGVETNYAGLMFPDGLHMLAYYAHYNGMHSMDNAGNDSTKLAYFHSEVNSVALRVTYVWPGIKWLGASVETRAALPVPTIDLKLGIARPPALGTLDKSGGETGIGDLQLAPILLGWHDGALHQTAGIEGFLPTAHYDAAENVNIGRNYRQIAPIYALTWLPGASQYSLKLRYARNGTNHDTGYRSGDELSVEFSAGTALAPGLSAGVNGYLYRQTTDDKLKGLVVNGNGNRGRVAALGPYLSYSATPKVTFILKLQPEFSARNRSQGTRLWLQTKIPL